MSDSRRQEAVELLREIGVDGEGVYRAFQARVDGQEPLAVIERQLRFFPYRDAPKSGTRTGQILAAIAGDWGPPARWEALQGGGRDGGRGRRGENAEAYEPVVRRREEVFRPFTAEEAAGWRLVKAYVCLESQAVRLPDGRVVRQCVCPSEAWAARTEELEALLGVPPWRDYRGVEGARELGSWERALSGFAGEVLEDLGPGRRPRKGVRRA